MGWDVIGFLSVLVRHNTPKEEELRRDEEVTLELGREKKGKEEEVCLRSSFEFQLGSLSNFIQPSFEFQ